VIYTKVWY